MRIVEFPKEEDSLSPDDAFIAYTHLADKHLYFLKKQSNCEFFYWNGAGIFFLATLAAFILHDKGIIPSALIGVLIAGLGCLLIFIQNIRMDFQYGIMAAVCVKKGLRIEKKRDYPARLFSIYEDNKLIIYRGNLLSRLAPMGLIGLATTGAGTLLALKAGAWLAIIVAAFSITVLSIAAHSYIKTVRKILLGD